MSAARRLHLDTDFGGDPDDACALAMLLGWPDVNVVGLTTNLERRGERAGAAVALLGLAGRDDLAGAVVAGAASTLTASAEFEPTTSDPRYWPDPVVPVESPAGAALDSLEASIEAGATVVTIGALTNLALLETMRPGTLGNATVVVMGGWIRPMAAGLPQWGPAEEFNVQCDPLAAALVLERAGELTLAPTSPLAVAHLREAHLPRLRAAGPLGRLLARQAEAYAVDRERAALAARWEALPDDLLNFHWDPVTCAVALGWEGAALEELRLMFDLDASGTLVMREDASGRPVRAVTAVDGPAFAAVWLEAVERAAVAAPSS